MRICILFFLVVTTTALAQDGSDIYYVKVDRLNNSYVGKFVHLDFYKRSFRRASIDSVVIRIDNKEISFIEHRVDNGFNNWLNDQYLESVEVDNEFTIRIVKARLEAISGDSIFVTNYLEFYQDGKLVVKKSNQVSSKFSLSMIAEVLVSAH